MLDYGKVTDTIYKRSVRKVIEKNVPGAGDDRIGGRDILYFAADSDKAMLTAFATLTGNQLAAAGAVHLAVNRLAAAGAYALAVNIQLIVSAELPEKSIKALMGSVSESCGKLHITSVQADVAAVPGLTETVITATAIWGKPEAFLNRKRPRRTRILSWLVMQAIMVRQSWLLPVRQSWSGILILYF